MRTLFTLALCLILSTLPAQELFQYFDGADTTEYNSIIIDLDTSATNIWQIGPPQKPLFNSASTVPNVIITDTVNIYPDNNISSFSYDVNSEVFGWGSVLAVHWLQKLDMDEGDGGIVEFSVNDENDWQNIFDNPYVYNLYGFEEENVDTLSCGSVGFTGTDTLWREVWLCYDLFWLDFQDTLKVRHTFKSDSIPNNPTSGKEGWMIDNMLVLPTIQHTIAEKEQEEYLDVYPSITDGRVFLQAKKTNGFHIIEEIQVLNSSGALVKEFHMVPTKFFIDLDDLPTGQYILHIKTNLETVSKKVMLNK